MWESTDLLKFELPFADMKVRIFLDKLLPRVIELSCYSGNLKTRVAACEVLYSSVIIFVGNSKSYFNKYLEITKKIKKSGILFLLSYVL